MTLRALVPFVPIWLVTGCQPQLTDGGQEEVQADHHLHAATASAKVSELDIPQPATVSTFDLSSQSKQPLSAIPRFVITNTGTTTQTYLYYAYSVRGTSVGADAGFGGSGSSSSLNIPPGGTSTQFIYGQLSPGTYQVVACGWAISEVPANLSAWPTVDDPAHCMQSTFTVSTSILAKVTELDIPQPATVSTFDFSSQISQPLTAIPRFTITNTSSATQNELYFAYSVQGTGNGASAGFGGGGTASSLNVAPGGTSLQTIYGQLTPGTYAIVACGWALSEAPANPDAWPTVNDPAHCMQTNFTVSTSILAKVTELDVPQPATVSTFDLWSQVKQPLSAIPRFTITNTSSVTQNELYFAYSVQGQGGGASAGFGGSGTASSLNVAPGGTSLQMIYGQLTPGTYQVVACGWALSEAPANADAWPTANDPAHCMQQGFTVSQ